MQIYPAVDLYEGKVVRLERGDYSKCKVYSERPEDTAASWASQGAQWLHVVDLEGARSGEIKNWQALENILEKERLSVQFGGGVRHKEDIDRLLKLGIQRVVIGTQVLDLAFLKGITQSYGERIAVSLDLKGEEIQIEGWIKGGGKSVFDLFHELSGYRIGCVVITDIEKDGTLMGIDLPKIERLLQASPFPIIYSGGISSFEDVRSLFSLEERVRPDRLEGVIIGKALYEGKVNLREAIQWVHKNKTKKRNSP